MLETDSPIVGRERSHQFTNGLNDIVKIGVVIVETGFEFRQF